MEILATRDSWWMTQCDAALLADGIEARWLAISGGTGHLLDVPVSDVERATLILSALLGEELKQRAFTPTLAPHAPLLLQPAFALGVMLLGLTLVAHAFSHRGGAELPWFGRGVLTFDGLVSGDTWQLVTAATLHADWPHALSNAGFFLVLAWAAGERLGEGITLLVWLGTAVAGFAISMVLAQHEATLGASGGLFGLLGAATGHAFRHQEVLALVRRARVRAFAGGVLLLAMTAFSPKANIHAHVGGFVVGMLLGVSLPRRPLPWAVQLLAALTTLAVVVMAWRRVLGFSV